MHLLGKILESYEAIGNRACSLCAPGNAPKNVFKWDDSRRRGGKCGRDPLLIDLDNGRTLSFAIDKDVKHADFVFGG